MIADVLLDPFHWSGGNISHDALAFGTPIVTLPGAYMRGRVTCGCYKQMGVMDCVASTMEEYVALAVRLGTDSACREQVKAKILAANGALYENINAVREMERFFLDAVARHADNS
jgi:predicted O-linked N-acetylglucosamine transferase (SPINDLY family)